MLPLGICTTGGLILATASPRAEPLRFPALYVVVNERDGLGDELVPDYLTRIEDGDFFG